MYVSLKWVEQIIQVPALSLNLLIEKLILAGFEVENIEKKYIETENSDIILDINITANRADSANFKGFTTELLSLLSPDLCFQRLVKIRPLVILSHKQKDTKFLRSLESTQQTKNYFPKLQIQNAIKVRTCFNFILFDYFLWENYQQKNYFQTEKPELIINSNENSLNAINCIQIFEEFSNQVLVGESPKWIKKRLLRFNFKPINNIIDTINYILIETGQVFFAYDIHALQDFAQTPTIKFVPKWTNEKISLSISNSEILFLNEPILALTLNQKIISLLGLIQDYNTIISRKTAQFLLQANIYDSRQIKKLSKITGLKTEYSIRLEKQVDLNLIEQAYFRLIYLFKVQGIHFKKSELRRFLFCKGEKSRFALNYIKQSQFKIKVFLKHIHETIGPPRELEKLPMVQVLDSLRALNFKVLHRTKDYLILQVPLARQDDIEQEVDIIEEIVRIIGFQQFPSILPYNGKNKSGEITKLEKFKRRLRTYFLSFGFNESLLSILSRKAISYEAPLKNPLFNDSSVLRVSLLKPLLEKVKFNQNIIQESFETFEIGRVYKFLNNSNGLKEEFELLSGVFGGKVFRSSWQTKDLVLNWFEAKGLLENLFTKLSISPKWKASQFEFTTIFHPTRTANIFINATLIGTFGQINPLLAIKENFNNQIYLFEFNIESLNKAWKAKTSVTYNQYSLYPISFIDLSCITKKSLSFQVIKEKIFRIGQPLLKSIELFDYYSEPPIKSGYCSLSFKLKFTSQTRTLLNSEVNAIVSKIVYSLESTFGIEFN